MSRPKANAQSIADIQPGDYITPPCQGHYRHVQCRWVPTQKYRNLWLCEECAKIYVNNLMVRRVKAKLLKERRRVTE